MNVNESLIDQASKTGAYTYSRKRGRSEDKDRNIMKLTTGSARIEAVVIAAMAHHVFHLKAFDISLTLSVVMNLLNCTKK